MGHVVEVEDKMECPAGFEGAKKEFFCHAGKDGRDGRSVTRVVWWDLVSLCCSVKQST
jgi:hypothetical protein